MSRRDDIRKLKINYQRRWQILREQQALKGWSVDPEILIEIEVIEEVLEELQRELEALEDTEPKQRVQIYLRGDFSSLSADRRSAAIDAFAALMGIPLQAIVVYRIYEGSIVFDLGIPANAVQRLRSRLQSNSAQLHLLKVEKVRFETESGEIEEWIIKKGKFDLVTSTHPTLSIDIFEKSPDIVQLKKLIPRRERDLQKLKEQQALHGPNTPPHILVEIEDITAKIERLKAALRQVEPAKEGLEIISMLASGQMSLTPESYERVVDLSKTAPLSVRLKMLQGILEYYAQLPEKLKRLVREFVNDGESILRAGVAAWIIRNYDEVGGEYEPILRQLAQDESVIVRQTIIDVASLEFGRLPTRIRLLVSELIGAPHIRTQIIKGSGMLVGKPSDLILKVTNQNETGSEIVQVEIIQPSAEYKVVGDNPVTIPELKAGHSAEVGFRLEMKVPRQVVVNYKVNGELKEPPLYINAVKDNPYVYGDPVKEETAFFGRRKELERIVQAVTKPTKQDILIVGERRTGKTSLLYQLQKRLDRPFIPVYVVLNTIEPKTESILDTILRKIVQSLIEHEILAKKWLEHRYPYVDFIDNLREVIGAAKANLAEVRIILLLDEADYLLKIRPSPARIRELAPLVKERPLVDERLQNILRAALQSSEVGADLRAVVAGTSDLLTNISQHSSPFFNHFRLEPLEPLTVQETHDLIVKPAASLGYVYSQNAIERITDLSGSQPYYCQALCYESFDGASQAKRNNINDEDVSTAEKKIIEDLFNSYLSGFWDRTNKMERRFLSALARNKAVKNITKAQINRLLDWQLITEAKGGYNFSSGLIEKWTIMASQG